MISRLNEIECVTEREKIMNRITRHKAKYPEEMHQKYLARIEKEFLNKLKISAILKEIKPLVNDEVYDELKDNILLLESKYSFLKSKLSPSKIVGYKPSKSFKKALHRAPMLSLANAFSE